MGRTPSAIARWSAYGTYGRLVRFAFFAFAVLSLGTSLVALGYGLWMCVTRSQYAEILSPSLYVDVGWIMVAMATLAVVNTAVAFVAIRRELRCLIYTFSTASLVLFIALLIAGAMGFVFRNNLTQMPLNLKMLTSLRELYGSADMPTITTAWDSLQTNFKCCGVNDTDDFRVWRTSKWHMHLHQTMPKPIVPDSCCVEGRLNECRNVSLSEMMATAFGIVRNNSSASTVSPIHMTTCYDPLRKDLLAVGQRAAWISVGASIFILFPAFFAAFYAKLIKK